MSTYFVKYHAFLDRLRRPDGWPSKFELKEIYPNIMNDDHLQAVVNKRFVEMVSSAGLVFPKDPEAMEDHSRVTYNTRRFIPWHMISYFEMDEPKLVADTMMPQRQSPDSEPKPILQ